MFDVARCGVRKRPVSTPLHSYLRIRPQNEIPVQIQCGFLLLFLRCYQRNLATTCTLVEFLPARYSYQVLTEQDSCDRIRHLLSAGFYQQAAKNKLQEHAKINEQIAPVARTSLSNTKYLAQMGASGETVVPNMKDRRPVWYLL